MDKPSTSPMWQNPFRAYQNMAAAFNEPAPDVVMRTVGPNPKRNLFHERPAGLSSASHGSQIFARPSSKKVRVVDADSDINVVEMSQRTGPLFSPAPTFGPSRREKIDVEIPTIATPDKHASTSTRPECAISEQGTQHPGPEPAPRSRGSGSGGRHVPDGLASRLLGLTSTHPAVADGVFFTVTRHLQSSVVTVCYGRLLIENEGNDVDKDAYLVLPSPSIGKNLGLPYEWSSFEVEDTLVVMSSMASIK